MCWFKKKPLGQRPLTDSEAEAYSLGHNDGTAVILSMFCDLPESELGEQATGLLKRLMLVNIGEQAKAARR